MRPDTTPKATSPPPALRWTIGLLVVAAWMALGWVLHLDVNGYLLLGVPITLVFQIGARRPLRTLWVRDGPPFRLKGSDIAVAAALAFLPLMTILGTLTEKPDWGSWGHSAVTAFIGAPAAAYALRQMDRPAWRAS